MGVLLRFTRQFMPPQKRRRSMQITAVALAIAELAETLKDQPALFDRLATFAEGEIELLIERLDTERAAP